jgi:hypothetical protein
VKIYKWLIALLIFILSQTACNLPMFTPAFPTETLRATTIPVPTSLPGFDTLRASETPSQAVRTLRAPTTLPGVTATSPATSYAQPPVFSLTPTFAPSETPTLLSAATQTTTPVALFDDPKLSAQVISLSCEPQLVRFDVAVNQPAAYSVVLFFRLRYKSSGDRTNWNAGVVMLPNAGRFIYDLKASSLTEFNQFKEPVAWVQFQFVATDVNRTILGRSEVFLDRLTLSALCP